MLLNPTYNRSLNAITHNNWFIPEATRILMSHPVYIYPIFMGTIIPNSMILVHGLKEVFQLGVMSIDGIKYTIQYDTLLGHYTTGLVWNDLFIFSPQPLSVDNWQAPTPHKFNSGV